MSGVEVQNKTISNLAWRFAERCGAQGAAFLASVVLARMLEPSDYGLISLVAVFTNILQVFVDGGLGNALIQKKDADDLDFSTVFYCNIIVCGVLYAGLFAAAPAIAVFYDNLTLTAVVRVLGLTVVLSGIKNVQQAFVSRHLIFKRFFYASLGGTIGSAVLGIYLAYRGFGVWALVVQQVSNTAVDTMILWATVRWRPKKEFSFQRLKPLLSYGWKLLASSLINTIYNDVRQLIIGKVYSSADLAFYNRGKQFPNLIVANINTSIDSVLLPVLSNSQNDRERVKNMTRRAIMTSSYILWPMMFGLMAVSENVVRIVLTEKWMACVPYLCIFCFISGMEPIHTANLNAINAIGRSDIFLKLEIFKKSVGILIILITMNISVFAIGMGSVVYTVFAGFVNAFPNRKLLHYPYMEQIRDILPSFLLSAFMALLIWKLPISHMDIGVRLFIQILAGILVYLAGSWLFRLESFRYTKTTVLNFIKNRQEKNMDGDTGE